MTKKQVIDLRSALQTLDSVSGVKIAYAVAKNKNILDSEIEVIYSSVKPNEDFKEYDAKRIELAKSSAKVVNGQPAIKNGPNGEEYDIEDQKKFGEALAVLKEQNKKVIEERDDGC